MSTHDVGIGRSARPLMQWIAGVVLLSVSALSLVSMGGLILFTGPVLVPLQIVAARRSGGPLRWLWVVFAAASAWLFVTLVAYALLGQIEALSGSLGGVAAVAAGIGAALPRRTTRSDAPSS